MKAASVLVQSVQLEVRPANVGQALLEKLRQALFQGAAELGPADILAAAQQAAPRRDLTSVCQAWADMWKGETQKAKITLHPVLAGNPGDPFALAVMVEIHLAGRESEAARALLADVLGWPDLPGWLAQHLNRLRDSLSS